MAIIGAHSIIYSKDATADRIFLRDILGLPSVDVGGGWLIFGLPPAELAFHPDDENGACEFYLMCDDVAAFVSDMTGRGMTCSPVQDHGWGLLTTVTLPGGGALNVYQPRHERPATASTVTARAARRIAAKKKPRRTGGKTARVKKKAARSPAKKRSGARRRAR
jgi:hypothetical protein